MSILKKQITIGVFATILGAYLLVILMNAFLPVAVSSGEESQDWTRCVDAGGTYNTSNTPLCHTAANVSVEVDYIYIPQAGLFGSSSAIWTVIVIAAFIGMLALAFRMYKGKQ